MTTVTDTENAEPTEAGNGGDVGRRSLPEWLNGVSSSQIKAACRLLKHKTTLKTTTQRAKVTSTTTSRTTTTTRLPESTETSVTLTVVTEYSSVTLTESPTTTTTIPLVTETSVKTFYDGPDPPYIYDINDYETTTVDGIQGVEALPYEYMSRDACRYTCANRLNCVAWIHGSSGCRLNVAKQGAPIYPGTVSERCPNGWPLKKYFYLYVPGTIRFKAGFGPCGVKNLYVFVQPLFECVD